MNAPPSPAPYVPAPAVNTRHRVHPLIIDAGSTESFPTPGALAGTSSLDVEPGWYAVQTARGPRRYLVTGDDAYKQVAAFVSSNVVHSLGDEERLNGSLDPGPLIEPLFYDDQPLRLFCGMASRLTGELLVEAGYESVEIVHLENAQGAGHVIVRVDTRDGWVMIDPDYGVAVTDRNGDWLDIFEVAEAIDAGRADDLTVLDLADDKAMRFPKGSPRDRMWDPDVMEHREVVYLDVIAEYSAKITTTPHGPR